MKQKFIIFTCSFIVVSCMITACDKKENADTKYEATLSTNESLSTNKQYYYEATHSAALTVKMEADMYFAENKIEDKVIHGYFKDDEEFSSDIISRHPALEGMEYVIEFNKEKNVLNVFLCQPDSNPITIACEGEHDNIKNWGFSSWEQILAYYNLSNDSSIEKN